MSTPKPDMTIAWAEIGGVTEPSDAKKQEGYVKEKVSYQLMNWLNNRADRYIQHNNIEGISEWDTLAVYDVGSLAKDPTDREIYRSLLGSNQGNQPSTDPANWEVAFTSALAIAGLTAPSSFGLVDLQPTDLPMLFAIGRTMNVGDTVTIQGVQFTRSEVRAMADDLTQTIID